MLDAIRWTAETSAQNINFKHLVTSLPTLLGYVMLAKNAVTAVTVPTDLSMTPNLQSISRAREEAILGAESIWTKHVLKLLLHKLRRV